MDAETKRAEMIIGFRSTACGDPQSGERLHIHGYETDLAAFGQHVVRIGAVIGASAADFLQFLSGPTDTSLRARSGAVGAPAGGRGFRLGLLPADGQLVSRVTLCDETEITLNAEVVRKFPLEDREDFQTLSGKW
jgi:hypothetical protein